MRYGITVLLLCTIGCGEPGTRYNVHDNGEGSVTVERVPKAPETQTIPAAQAQSDQQRIDQLQAQVHALSVENQKLKATTAPSSLGAKD